MLQWLLHGLAFFVLTVLTQVGGLIYLFNELILSFTALNNQKAPVRIVVKGAAFCSFYALISIAILPILAKPLGRVPMPVSSSGNLRPLNVLTCILNRHYVRPEMRTAALIVSSSLAEKYPGVRLNYLDANFPFFNGFSLVPHLSHNDGKKLDLAFFYDLKDGTPTNAAPSFIGYGICEEPRPGEPNTADECAQKGAWQYSFLKHVVPQGNSTNYLLNEEKTANMVELFSAQPSIGKIFIEPHLKQRLKLQSAKIRFHGCRAVRHDDHLHVQLK